MTSGIKRLNMKDKLDEDRLDLSMCDLVSVPVKEIVDIQKARKLNLSFNNLIHLPEDFIKLQHIREIDLSKNHLKALPKNFGQLTNLRYLDLLGNDLECLPLSFADLRSLQVWVLNLESQQSANILRQDLTKAIVFFDDSKIKKENVDYWLDLKNNPLNPQLRTVAGDCLDEKECKKCAQSVLRYMKQLASDEERKRQEILKQKRELELKNQIKEEEERQRQKEVKRLEKLEKKRQEIASREQAAKHQNNTTDLNTKSTGVNATHQVKKNRKLAICLRFIFMFVFISTLTVFLAALYCENPLNLSSSFVNLTFMNDFCVKFSIHDFNFIKRLFQN